MIAGQRILDRIAETVSHVQRAGDVRRRNHDAIGFAVAVRRKITVVLPTLVDALLDLLWLVGLVHVSCRNPIQRDQTLCVSS